jgi:hypothetical protein
MSTRKELRQRQTIGYLEKALLEVRLDRDKAEALLAARTREWNEATERIRQLERTIKIARDAAEIIGTATRVV